MVDLLKEGVIGNDYFIFQDLNNDVAADHVENWPTENSSRGCPVALGLESSEKIFWKKVLEIYATSIDYNLKAESSVQFFKQVQNKRHWTAHQHTAAEVIYQRADADKDNMGLTTWSGSHIKRSDVEVAKNYLDEKNKIPHNIFQSSVFHCIITSSHLSAKEIHNNDNTRISP